MSPLNFTLPKVMTSYSEDPSILIAPLSELPIANITFPFSVLYNSSDATQCLFTYTVDGSNITHNTNTDQFTSTNISALPSLDVKSATISNSNTNTEGQTIVNDYLQLFSYLLTNGTNYTDLSENYNSYNVINPNAQFSDFADAVGTCLNTSYQSYLESYTINNNAEYLSLYLSQLSEAAFNNIVINDSGRIDTSADGTFGVPLQSGDIISFQIDMQPNQYQSTYNTGVSLNGFKPSYALNITLSS